MTARKAKRSEGLHSGSKAGERGGKRRVGSLSPRPLARNRAEALSRAAKSLRIHEALKVDRAARRTLVESRLSADGVSAPRAMVSRIARLSSGYVVTAAFYGPDYVRHEVEASAPTFRGALAELASAVSGALGVA